MDLYEQVWRAIDELCHEWESQAQDIAAVVLGFEVSPGVTLDDAVRAYLAHAEHVRRFGWAALMVGEPRPGVEEWRVGTHASVYGPACATPAAAILAAAEAER